MSKTVAQKKITVELLTNLINENNTLGFANIESLPAPQLQRMRFSLKDVMLLVVAKKTLIKKAFEQAKDKPGLNLLIEKMTGMPALVFTKENPFKLAATLKKNKSKAPAKPGQTAPNDIVIPAGPTSFDPGPIISDLGNIGLKTGVENGKVAVKEDSLVAKEGEEISENVANVLAKLGIEPMEVGLNLVAIYDEGTLYDKTVLSVDESHYHDQLRVGITDALALALSLNYVTSDTIKPLLSKAFTQARYLALEHEILSDESIKQWLSQAERVAQQLQHKVPDTPVPQDTIENNSAMSTDAEEKSEDTPSEDSNENSEAEEKKAEEKDNQ